MTAAPSTDPPADESLEESASGLSKRIMKSRDLQRSWIDDLEEIGKRVDSLFGEQTETEDGPGPSNGQGSRIPVKSPIWSAAATPISQSLPTSSGLLQTLTERRRGQSSSSAAVSPTSEGQLNYSAHDRSHFVAPPPRALTVYIGSDDTDLGAIRLPLHLASDRHPQLTHSRLFQSATSSTSTSPVLSIRTGFGNGQGAADPFAGVVVGHAPAHDILSSYVTPRRGPGKITRSRSFGSNTSPIKPMNTKRTQPSPRRRKARTCLLHPRRQEGDR